MSLPSRWVVAVSVAMAAAILGDSLMYAVLPVRWRDFGLEIAMVGVLLSVNRWARLLTNPIAGWAMGRFGPARALSGRGLSCSGHDRAVHPGTWLLGAAPRPGLVGELLVVLTPWRLSRGAGGVNRRYPWVLPGVLPRRYPFRELHRGAGWRGPDRSHWFQDHGLALRRGHRCRRPGSVARSGLGSSSASALPSFRRRSGTA